MRKLKLIASLGLAFTMVLSLCLTASGAEYNNREQSLGDSLKELYYSEAANSFFEDEALDQEYAKKAQNQMR